MPTTDHRLAAKARVLALIQALTAQSPEALAPLIDECQALARAIEAFHMEGIRFRMFNVDRLLTRTDLPIPAEAARALRAGAGRARGRRFPHPIAPGATELASPGSTAADELANLPSGLYNEGDCPCTS